MSVKALPNKMSLPRTSKICLVCGCKYHNSMHSKKLDACPNCGTSEIEHITFRYIFQQKPYDAETLPSCPDIGCDVATSFQGNQSTCQKCPFESCLAELHFRWCYYATRKRLVSKGWRMIDKDMDSRKISDELHVPISFVLIWKLERNVIQPIYEKLKHKNIIMLKGPKTL